MNKNYIILFLSITLALTGCNNKTNKVDQNTMTSGYIKIAVDQTVQDIIENEIAVFESLYPAKIDAIYTTETNAIDLFLKDTVRLAITARDLSEGEYNLLRAKTFRPEAVRIAIDGVAVITHPSNKDSMISELDLKKVLTGKITEWKQLDPTSKLGKIQVVFDNTKSSIVRYAADSITKDEKLSKNLNALELNEEVVEHVAKNPAAMGLIGVNTISDDTDSTVVDFTKKIKVMRISYHDIPTPKNSVQPYQYYLYTGSYPFRRDIFILLNDPRGELPKGFTRFVSSDQGQRIIKRTGLLPSTMPVNTVNVHE